MVRITSPIPSTTQENPLITLLSKYILVGLERIHLLIWLGVSARLETIEAVKPILLRLLRFRSGSYLSRFLHEWIISSVLLRLSLHEWV